MFLYKRTVRVEDTDATGFIYFANILKMGLEAFEELLYDQKFSLRKMMESKKFLLPIVHSEADFFSPLKVGDRVDILLKVTQIGTTSFTHSSEFMLKEGKKVGKTSIVHVAFSPELQKSISLESTPLHTLLLNQMNQNV